MKQFYNNFIRSHKSETSKPICFTFLFCSLIQEGLTYSRHSYSCTIVKKSIPNQ